MHLKGGKALKGFKGYWGIAIILKPLILFKGLIALLNHTYYYKK